MERNQSMRVNVYNFYFLVNFFSVVQYYHIIYYVVCARRMYSVQYILYV